MHAWDTLPYQVHPLKVRASGAQDTPEAPSQVLTPRLRPQLLFFLTFLQTLLLVMPGLSSHFSWFFYSFLAPPLAFLPRPPFLRGPETLGVNSWEPRCP